MSDYDGALISEGLYDKTIEVLEKAMVENPTIPDYRVGLVLRLEAAGRLDEALALMEEATESEDPAQVASAFFAQVCDCALVTWACGHARALGLRARRRAEQQC